MNPQQHGCVTIKEDETGHISIFLSNPEPRWKQINPDDLTFPSKGFKVQQRPDNVIVYLAKVIYNASPFLSPDWKASFLFGVWQEIMESWA